MEGPESTLHGWTGISGRRKYMSKAQRACDGCRARKSACQIDVAPPCRLCRAHGQACEFTSRIRRRRSPLKGKDGPASSSAGYGARPPSPQGHARTFSDMIPLSDTLNLQSPLAGLDGGPSMSSPFHPNYEGGLNAQPDQTMFDDLVLSMYDTYQPSPLPQGLASRPRSLDHLPDLTAQLCGLTGDMDPYVLQHYQFDENSEFAFSKLTVRQVQRSAVPVQFLLSKQELTAESRAEARLSPTAEPVDLNALVPPEIGERLIKLFYRFIQPQFPILSEDTPPSPTTAPAHLLAAIYCIAQPFATFDDHLCIELVYTPPEPQTLVNLAWRNLNDTLSQPTTSSIQTALLLLLRLPTNPLVLDSAWKWTLLGMTVSTAQTLGLHLDARSWNLPPPEATLRRRLSWLVYAMDKWLAFSFGRPSHISSEDWLVTELSELDLVSETEGPKPVVLFPLEFSKLTSILDLTLSRLYSIRASATLAHDFRLTFETARPLLDKLAHWASQNAHPAAPSPETPTLTPSVNTLTGYQGRAPLHIAYHAVKTLVLRALLRPFNHPESQVSVTPQDKAEWDAAQAHIRHAARAEIDATLARISRLEAVDYQAFWAPWYKTCFAMTTHLIFLLAVTSFFEKKGMGASSEAPDADPDPDLTVEEDGGKNSTSSEYVAFRQLLDQARAVLRLHARSLDIIKFALLRIDAVFWMGWEKVLGFG